MWKPKINEEYYFPYTNNNEPQCIKRTWQGSQQDELYYERGFVCETKEEAIEKANIMLDLTHDKYIFEARVTIGGER